MAKKVKYLSQYIGVLPEQKRWVDTTAKEFGERPSYIYRELLRLAMSGEVVLPRTGKINSTPTSV